ncbi:hypothetical protein CCAX7_47880 [Capsulimonas corticalis]|uniref:Uncharacterized protein n=1 Tax=Capsulimonas corticalis TaxID=2219043 RepID=A0A402CQ14_9BACT|nr:PLD nuclease N-terminal domain-containing protein [Capsulimonas corticalis]BDI32737.1 hypothetical protein CCAX7_47880 [Capsulimonas corticalis]
MEHDPTPWIFGGGIALVLIVGLLGLLSTIFWIVEIVDVIRRDFENDNLKIVWLLVIIFTHFLGALIYYFVGKNQGRLRV